MKCGQVGCEAEATHTFRWPNSPDPKPACAPHAAKAKLIAHALGVYPQVEELLFPASAEVDSSNVFACASCGHVYSDPLPCPECGFKREGPDSVG